MKIFALCFLLLLFLPTGCAYSPARPSESPAATDYPPSIPRKAEAELRETERRFKEANGASWRLTLNPYTGIIFSATALNYREFPSPPSEGEAEKFLTEFLDKNRAFFGLEVPFRLEADREEAFGYTFRVKPYQTLSGLEIAPSGPEGTEAANDRYQSRIRLLHSTSPNAFTRSPHLELYVYEWYRYPQIPLPQQPTLSKDEAIAKLPPDLRQAPLGPATLMVLPWASEKKESLVFRLCWRIEVGYSPQLNNSTFTAYVDAITGETLAIRQNFLF